jgi:hypothetical protein
MTHDQSEAYRIKKTEILAKDPNVYDPLEDLAKKVGASTTNRDRGHGKATIPQLVENIDSALQTASMIETCRIATENCDIAQRATKAAICHYRIAAGIAILAMIAAWVAIFVNQ